MRRRTSLDLVSDGTPEQLAADCRDSCAERFRGYSTTCAASPRPPPIAVDGLVPAPRTRAAASARRLGVRVIEVDGTRAGGAVAAEVATHFGCLVIMKDDDSGGIPDSS